MTEFAIIDIYDTVKSSNGEYCRVCFHTSAERKLVVPVYLKRFLNVMTGCALSKLSKAQLKVCYICEALATSVMHFHAAVQLGGSIEELFSMMTTEDSRNAVVKHLSSKNRFTSSQACKRALQCETALQCARRRAPHTLQRTDTLVVSSDAPDDNANGQGNTGVQGQVPLQRLSLPTITVPFTVNGATQPLILNGATPPLILNGATCIQNVNNAPIINMPPFILNGGNCTQNTTKRTKSNDEVLVILDDDEAPRPPKRDVHVSIVPQGVRVRNKDSDGYVLHPMVEGSDGNIYVPSLKLKLLKNKVLQSASDAELLQHINTTTPPVTHEETTKRPASKVRKGEYYDFVRTQKEMKKNDTKVNHVEVVTMDDLNIVLNMDSDETVLGKRPLSDPLEANFVSESETESAKRVRDDQVPKKPVLSTGRVDWEDKIPMDVISYMNATDPNPNERIMQPTLPSLPTLSSSGMGVISDVRTIDDNEEEVQIVENIECIDLC